MLIALFGASWIVSGIWVMDPVDGFPPGTPSSAPSESTLAGQLHDAAGLVVLTSLPVAMFVLARWFAGNTEDGRRWAAYSMASGVMMTVFFVGFAIADESGSNLSGLFQRTATLLGWTWIGLAALEVRSEHDGLERQSIDQPAIR